MEIRDASALVTGAGRGIGRSIALALAREGARITAVARTAAELDSLVEEVETVGGRGVAFAGDLRSPSACEGAVAAAVDCFGGLQILINNAGVGAFSNVADTTDDEWDTVIGTNLNAAFRLTRAALPHLSHHGGHVFMISSLAGRNPIAGMAAYCASKAALDHFAACLMLEVRQKGVKVTTIAPGSVDTAFAGAPRPADTAWMLTAEDVARTVLDLLRMRDGAHSSRVEMRPARPQKR
ncbi:MAG TPA: SDR family NAD(P)-dependent oxidoreductase [Vicinamibacteria bacterium]|nr:SDR family NAD(P)-dependent oxidoreductase [Vicinamibacteria bacterium]